MHAWDHTMLPVTMLPPIGKDLSPITTQSSTAVTHCIPAVLHFTYREEMEGRVNPPAQESNPRSVAYQAATVITRSHRRRSACVVEWYFQPTYSEA